ncbi:hypothetical protein [Promicromonospora iranensis]|uniref:MinD-like ATPase involved in chromosome partitioning or flagellar assembly n=1 Tax=Promicromonospora iranensis TaxID=1105144 RepID=A0ABU2CJ55_9MICO|nr:hypothetical protein [Promicromonospora iranensis]MDR7381227.1 hypothetical protein [Promicromonospora iranensis]
MAVIALCSASGSPGVTTTAVGLAIAWPRPVLLIEADPVGGSAILAGWFQGARDHDAGLLDVAFAAEPVAAALDRVAIPLRDGVRFVPGVRSHLEARELGGLWGPLADVLAGLDAAGQDVIVDAGRLGMADSPRLLLERADLTLLVTRTDLPALAAVRSYADLVVRTRAWKQAGLLVIGPGRPYSGRGAAKLLGLPLVGKIAHSAKDAETYHQGVRPRARFPKGAFARSLHATAGALHQRTSLGTPSTTALSAEPDGATDVAQGRVPGPGAIWATAADRRQEQA